jgi:hypothetical protein
MALAFTGTAVQRLTEQGMELFGGMGRDLRACRSRSTCAMR